MQDHPIPQAVTSYEFHLIGNMTLKQFLELAAGIVIGVLIFQTNLPDIIKWPLIVFFVGLGALIAFIPYEGRPMDQWFIALIRAIYKPTQFYWKKSQHVPEYLTYVQQQVTTLTQDVDLSPYKQKRIMEYIKTLPAETAIDPIEYQEMQQLSSVMSLFDTVQVERVEAIEQLTRPDLTMTTHSLQQYEDLFETPNTPVQMERVTADQIPPTLPPIIEEAQQAPETEVEEAPVIIDVFSTQPEQQAPVEAPTQNIQTSNALPFPKKPTQPNIVVGMVFDQVGNIVENAIVEISDEQGMPVRAVRTNRIGQFFISTPLKNGEYYMKVEKDDILFTNQKLVLNDTILDPVEIRATG